MAAKVRCNLCQETMERLDWMTKTHCENPNCRCPEVQKLIQATQAVIVKAQGNRTIVNVQRGPVPHGYNAEAANGQYVIGMPDVKVITVTPIKRK
jgi:hypothetical protein